MSRISSQIFLIGLTVFMVLIFSATVTWPHQELILSALAGAMIIGSLILERLIPYDQGWNRARGDGWGDIISLGLILAAIEPALKWALPLALLWVLGDQTGLMADWPLWLQILLVLLVTELAAWVSHWLHHNTRWLWLLHAVHHSPERLYTLNNFRFHPLNHALNTVFVLLPALALGASSTAILGYVAITYPVLLLQHSNVRFQFGWLNYVLNTNQVHRWHHSANAGEGNHNYGRTLVIWDQIFATFLLPGGAPQKLGLFASSRDFPGASRYFRQMIYPFLGNCCARTG